MLTTAETPWKDDKSLFEKRLVFFFSSLVGIYLRPYRNSRQLVVYPNAVALIVKGENSLRFTSLVKFIPHVLL